MDRFFNTIFLLVHSAYILFVYKLFLRDMLESQRDDLQENISLVFTAKICFHFPFEREQETCRMLLQNSQLTNITFSSVFPNSDLPY